jgi:formate dehydrogenase maturation protein FdhE
VAGNQKLGHMAQHLTVPSHAVTIDRRLCLICGGQMSLAVVEADGATHDKRTFECPLCETHEFEFVKFK